MWKLLLSRLGLFREIFSSSQDARDKGKEQGRRRDHRPLKTPPPSPASSSSSSLKHRSGHVTVTTPTPHRDPECDAHATSLVSSGEGRD